MARLAVLAALAAAAVVHAQSPAGLTCAGPIKMTIDGVAQTWQVATFAGSTMRAPDGNSIVVPHDTRGYIVPSCSGSTFSPSLFAQRLPLLNKTLTFTVDLSGAGCGCNVALYTVFMPGYSANGAFSPGQAGDFYCDANDVGGNWCPEMDIIEANTAALQVTPHTCAAPVGHYYPSCDKGGCGVNSYRAAGPSAYGPGSQYTIDTSLPFNVSTTWAAMNPSGTLSSVTTVLQQGGGVPVTLRHTDATCGSGYLEAMTPALAGGMVPTMSSWGESGETMKWLDVPPCDLATACDDATAAGIFSNFIVESL